MGRGVALEKIRAVYSAHSWMHHIPMMTTFAHGGGYQHNAW